MVSQATATAYALQQALAGGASGCLGVALAVTLAPVTGRSPRAGFDLNVGVQGLGYRDDQRQLRARLLGREQAPDTRGIVPHTPRQLGLRHPGVLAQLVQRADNGVDLLDLAPRTLVLRAGGVI